MNKKVLILATIAILAVLTSSIIATSYAWRWRRKTPKIIVAFQVEMPRGQPKGEVYGDYVIGWNLPRMGTVTLFIFADLPNPTPTHMYSGTAEGKVSYTITKVAGEGHYHDKYTYFFEGGTFEITGNANGVGYTIVGNWKAVGTGIFEGIKASGVLSMDITPPDPMEKNQVGTIKMGDANLPPSNFPPASP